MAPKIHPDQVDRLCIFFSWFKQTHYDFLPKKKWKKHVKDLVEKKLSNKKLVRFFHHICIRLVVVSCCSVFFCWGVSISLLVHWLSTSLMLLLLLLLFWSLYCMSSDSMCSLGKIETKWGFMLSHHVLLTFPCPL
jgi:hypothetical protein